MNLCGIVIFVVCGIRLYLFINLCGIVLFLCAVLGHVPIYAVIESTVIYTPIEVIICMNNAGPLESPGPSTMGTSDSPSCGALQKIYQLL